jgi:uncharacterized DUF497 family protein
MNNDPLDLDCDVVNEEERYRAVELTNGGRFLLVAYTFRRDRIRAVTAFPASASNKRDFLGRPR